jgi:arsenate reductase (thioredoxin)
MTKEKLKVLFLCTGNSARSIIAEALLKRLGKDRFESYSAGSIPRGKVNPFVLEILKMHDFDTDSFRSKSWDEYATENSPKFDFIFTVCDQAANEICPVWPGQPISAHWRIEDPDNPELSDSEQRKLFQRTYHQLEHRIKIFTDLSFDNMESTSMQKELDDIGKVKRE